MTLFERARIRLELFPLCALFLCGLVAAPVHGSEAVPPSPAAPKLIERTVKPDVAYVLGPEDELSIHVNELEEITDKPVRIDPNGMLSLPVIGKVKAAGLSLDQFQAELVERLSKTLKHPEVSLNIVAFHSQPVTVLGSVNQPGVQQLQGPKRLLEVISSAGGLRSDAGHSIVITRQAEWGPLPLAKQQADRTGEFSTARLDWTELADGKRPEENIYLRPHDVVSVNRADVVYVIGEVKKSGGFTMLQNENLTVLQALALAEGLQRTASPKSAKILRKNPETQARVEIPVNVKKMMDGEANDVPMFAEDILVIPNNLPRSVALRTTEAAIQIATGLLIYGR